MPKSKYTDEFKKEVGEATFEEGMSLAKVGEKLRVDILGKMYEATILEESPYDNENKLLRA